MAYLIGNDQKSGIIRPTLPRKPSLPGKPVGLRARPTLEDVDPDMADRLRYTQSVYGGDAAQIYQAHRAAIDSQFDYTMQRTRSGKQLLPVADPHWRPDRYTDATNEDWAQWYQKQSEQPNPPEQTDPTAADHVKLMRQYRQQRAADESALPRGLPTKKAPSDTQAPLSEPFDWMGLANNPYKELAKLLPQGPLRSVTNGVGTGFQYLPSTLVRDYVMPVPGMLVKNAVKAVDDAAEGKPLSFDPEVSAYELFGRSAQAARRTGQTEIADGLEFLLNDPVGKVVLSALGEMTLDPLSYAGLGIAKAGKALQALKAAKAAEAADISTDILRAEKTAQAMDTPPMQGTAVTEKPPLAKALDAAMHKAESTGVTVPPAVADEVPKGYTGGAGETIVGSEHNVVRPTQDAVNPVKVEEYARRLRAGEKIPPVHLIEVPGRGQFILNGHHRYVASLRTGIPVEIKVTQSYGPIGMPDWSGVKWKEYINEEQFWGD